MATYPILDAHAKNWWVYLIKGIIGVLFGIMAFTRPGLTLVTLLTLFGIYALVDGITALWVGGGAHSWWLVLAGILGVIAGIYTFIYPGITAVALLYLIVAWAIIRGITEIITAIRMRKEMSHEWVLIIAGVFSILFGLLLYANAGAGVLAMVWAIGAYALVYGLMWIVQAFRLRGLPERLEKLA